MHVNITPEHKESGERSYLTPKNKYNTPDRLQLKRYSPKLRKHVIFAEVKQSDTLKAYEINVSRLFQFKNSIFD